MAKIETFKNIFKTFSKHWYNISIGRRAIYKKLFDARLFIVKLGGQAIYKKTFEACPFIIRYWYNIGKTLVQH